MKISVVIPSYNQQEFLPEAIESVLAQTYKPEEIIVIDDGSNDKSLSLARHYEKLGVKVVAQVNKGLSSARNTGIMNATGEYVLPLDADDLLLETCLAVINQKIEETGADVVAPSFKCFGVSQALVILNSTITLEAQKQANHLGYCAAIRRSCLLEVGGYSPRMTWGYEDYHLWFDLLNRGKKFVTIPEVLWLYRTKEQSMIHEAQKHHQELMGQIVKDFPLL